MKKVFILQIAVVVVTIIVCVFSTKYIICYIHDDYDRLYNINEWTQDSNIKPEIVFFGSSEAMNSVDGDLIKEKYNKEAVSYTNTGQSMAEAFLFYSRVPSSTKYVVQVMRSSTFAEGIYINDVKVNRLVINGYQLEDFTMSLLNERTIAKLEKSLPKASFDIRGYFKNGIHGYLRELLEPGQYNETSNTYIRNAYMFNYERAPEEQFQMLLRTLQVEQKPTLEVDQELVESMRKASAYFKSRGIKYVVVFSPISSNATQLIQPNYKEVLDGLNFDFSIIDYTNLLEEDGFADPVHPNRKGAKVFTNQLMKDLFTE